jgi:hypothetical protein
MCLTHKPVKEETVTVDIRVKFKRQTYTDGVNLDLRSFKPKTNGLTPDEQDEIVDLIMESGLSNIVLKAFLDALAGKTTKS